MSESKRVAVVGCGYWGKNLVRNFNELGALAFICDGDAETARDVSETFDVEPASFSRITADPGIDAVVISTPASQHFDLAKKALLADKHVFVEKPMALRIQDAEELRRLAYERGRVLMVGHLMQYHPAFIQLKQLVDEGKLGRIQYLYSTRLNLGKFRREESILWSFAPHDISMILSLVGTEPEKVVAQGASYLHQRVADVTTTHLSFPGGERAHVFVSWLHPFKEQKLVVVGHERMAVFDDGMPWETKLRIFPHRIDWRSGIPEPTKAEAEPVLVAPAEPLQVECRHFLDCITSGTTPRTDADEGLRVLRVLDQAERTMSMASSLDGDRFGTDVMVHESAYVDDNCEIGVGTKIWHFTHVLSGSTIGEGCVLGQNVAVGPDVVVGNGCKIQNNVSLYKGVTLEDDVFCGPSAVFTNVLNPRAAIDRKSEFQSTVVRSGATIGANATIICGVELGANCFVAAGAVVTKDVPPHALVAGVPARRVGWVSHSGEKLDDDLICPRSGRRYQLIGDEILQAQDD